MGLFNRKSNLERLLDAVESIDLPNGVKSGFPGGGAGKGLKAGLITAASVAGLTAASAGISSLRRKSGDDS